MSIETDTTPQRIIEAAGEVFAERGFEAATVREICRRGNANLAAINYHFGDKQRLYIEAVKRAHLNRIRQHPLPDWPEGTPAAERLADFVKTLLMRMIGPADSHWESELMSREIARPSEACAAMARESIQPDFRILGEIMAELMPGATEQKLHLAAFSVVGQCLHYRIAEPIIRQLVSDEEYQQYRPELLAEHITDLTLRGIGARRNDSPGGMRWGG